MEVPWPAGLRTGTSLVGLEFKTTLGPLSAWSDVRHAGEVIRIQAVIRVVQTIFALPETYRPEPIKKLSLDMH